jgi:multiple sugar transport system ATP-binding protein
MAGLKLTQLNKTYPNGFKAVKDIDLTIEDKEFMVLVGPSGCGKTTTLRMIAGLEEITKGTMEIGDKIVNDVAPKDRDIAMVFQNYALYPHMTVYDNMGFALKLRKMSKQDIKDRVHKAAEILGIESMLTRKPKELSGGQRQRVALGRAIVRQPQVFLMDEPLSNLDAKLRVQMRAELIKLHRELQTTFVYVTHDQTEAMTMGTRICVMNNGLIQQVDTPAVIYNHPANKFVASFIGAPQMNFIPVTLTESEGQVVAKVGDAHLVLHSDDRLKAYVGKTVDLGLRPENCLIGQGGFKAVVELRELLGSETYLYLKLGELSLIARVSPDVDYGIGDTVEVSIKNDQYHVFDKETEMAVL